MFTYVHLKNFKSFGNIYFNLLNKYNVPKKMSIVYGENGIGKSNLVSAFYFLTETLHTMDVRDIVQNILKSTPDEIPDEEFVSFIKRRFKDTEALINEYKMVQSDENLYLEFGFILDGKKGMYTLEMNDNEVVEESLEYFLSKRRGKYFQISKDKIFLSDKVFLDGELINNLHSLISQFWGKHTFLSLLLYDIAEKSNMYYKDRLSQYLNTVISFMTNISCKIKCGNTQEQGILSTSSTFRILHQLFEGKIKIEERTRLDQNEKMLRCFLTTLNSDIKDVFYKRVRHGQQIQYQLYIKKFICGKKRELSFNLESTGTQRIIELLPYMMLVTTGATVVIDEFDLGMHDLMVQNLITSLGKSVRGQLIITTHNTLLMESNLPAECFYVINESKEGNKEIECILKYDNKIGPKTNIRNQFYLGKYHGIPDKFEIDFRRLVDILDKKSN